jgi:hypothetical protein
MRTPDLTRAHTVLLNGLSASRLVMIQTRITSPSNIKLFEQTYDNTTVVDHSSDAWTTETCLRAGTSRALQM